jgi:hypothetical protein
MSPIRNAIATLSFLLFASPLFAGCDLIEDPPVSESNCNEYGFSMAASSPWTLLQANPANFGLLSIGSINASASLTAANGATVVAQILPMQPGLANGKVGAKAASTNDKVELVLNKTGATQSLQLNVIRNGTVAQSYSSNLPSASNTSFDLSYGFLQGELNVKVHSGSGQNFNINVSGFGQTLPLMMLRRGADAGSQVSAAAFTQTGYSGQ